MECRYCGGGGGHVDVLATLPLEIPIGEEPFGCRICMIERGLWCPIHDKPFEEWGKIGNNCRTCAYTTYEILRCRADDYYEYLLAHLPERNGRALVDWANEYEEIVPRHPAECVLHELVFAAACFRLPPRDYLEEVARSANLESIIPRAWPVAID